MLVDTPTLRKDLGFFSFNHNEATKTIAAAKSTKVKARAYTDSAVD
jgi:hypothetical protein